jgi:hypothetical protein
LSGKKGELSFVVMGEQDLGLDEIIVPAFDGMEKYLRKL